MKPPLIPLEQIRQLSPIYRLTVPPTFRGLRDPTGHMNMRYYQAVFDDAGDEMVAQFGLTMEFYVAHQSGGFDLEHHINYLKEVMIGEEIVVYPRFIQRTAKRLHYMMFMVNDTREVLAATFECVNSYGDLTVRRTAPYPPEIAAGIDHILVEHQQLRWPAPVCGVMSA